MTTRFMPGQKVTWLYWPPDARYRMAVHVEAEVVRLTDKKVVVKCWDRRGKEHTRVVSDIRLAHGYHPHATYANGFYPVKGDAPEYKQREAQ